MRSRMAVTVDDFVELLEGGRETRAVEFKSAGPRIIAEVRR